MHGGLPTLKLSGRQHITGLCSDRASRQSSAPLAPLAQPLSPDGSRRCRGAVPGGRVGGGVAEVRRHVSGMPGQQSVSLAAHLVIIVAIARLAGRIHPARGSRGRVGFQTLQPGRGGTAARAAAWAAGCTHRLGMLPAMTHGRAPRCRPPHGARPVGHSVGQSGRWAADSPPGSLGRR